MYVVEEHSRLHTGSRVPSLESQSDVSLEMDEWSNDPVLAYIAVIHCIRSPKEGEVLQGPRFVQDPEDSFWKCLSIADEICKSAKLSG